MIQVIPAIIPESFEHLKEQMSLVCDVVPRVQIDITDGKFAPSKTWPFQGDRGEFAKIATEEVEFPFWDKLDFELDMMVEQPEDLVDSWIAVGATALIIHVDSTNKLEEIIYKAKSRGVEVGLALKPKTPNDFIKPWLLRKGEDEKKLIDFVQFMGSDRIGFHGVPLDGTVFKKIEDLRNDFPDCIIGVDIGVNFETAPRLIEAGANKLISGSSIYSSGNIREAILRLKNER